MAEFGGLYAHYRMLNIKLEYLFTRTHHAKMDLNKKFRPMKKTIQTFKLDAQGFQKTMFENPPTQKIFLTLPPPRIEPGTFRAKKP